MPVPDLEISVCVGGGWSSRPLVEWEAPVSKKTFPRVPPLDPPLIYPHVRESKTVLDSRFHSVDSVIQVLDLRFLSVEPGFRIRIASGIPESLI